MYIVYTIITVRHNQNYKAKQLQIYAAYYNNRFIYKNIFREHSASMLVYNYRCGNLRIALYSFELDILLFFIRAGLTYM